MNRVHPRNGPAVAFRGGKRCRLPGKSGFTLLEMCIVLLIIAMLFGLATPALQSAMTEQKVRADSHQLALMVKTAMIQSGEQHRAYDIDLTATTMALHPAGVAAADADDSSDDSTDADTDASTQTVQPNVSVTSNLDPSNKLLVPDPTKADAWIPMPDGTEWVFQPGDLCPATVVRFGHGDAWIQLTFDALTGNVSNETYSLP